MKVFNKRIILIVLIFCLTIDCIEAAYDILKKSPSPAGFALGDSCSSLYIDHAVSWYYNPAFLGLKRPLFSDEDPFVNNVDFFSSYTYSFAEINSFSFYSILDVRFINRLGIGFDSSFYGDIQKTSYQGESYIISDDLSINSYCFSLAWGTRINKRFNLGLSIKLPMENFGEEQYVGLGGDMGLLYNNGKVNLSLVFRNMGIDIKGPDPTEYLPGIIVLGGNYSFLLSKIRKGIIHRLTFTSDIQKELQKDYKYNLGIQYGLSEILFIRSGYSYNIDRQEGDLRAGFGVQYQRMQMDYCYSSVELGHIHRIGLGYKLNLKKKKMFHTMNTNGGLLINIYNDDSVIFKRDSHILEQTASESLDDIVEIINERGNKVVIIQGNIDDEFKQYNRSLSYKRASAVYEYFAMKGIAKQRMRYTSNNIFQVINVDTKGDENSINKQIKVYISPLNNNEKQQFDFHYYLGRDYFLKEGYELAVMEWKKALKIDPKNKDLKRQIEYTERLIKKIDD